MTDKRYWETFVESYVAREGFWHVPKQSVSPETEEQLRGKLRVLRSLEGKPWRTNQERYARLLVRKKLTTTTSPAFARVQKAMFDYLGFSWVGPDGRLRITRAGRLFIAGRALESLIRRQLSKFQFWNPAAVGKFKDFRLLPHIFLLQALLRFGKKGISRDEYLLFVCRATSHDDISTVVDLVKRYRKLAPRERDTLRAKVEAKKAAKGKSPYRAASLDYGYAISFFGYPAYVSHEGDRILVAPGSLNQVKEIVRRVEESGVYINFRNEPEWFDFYGDFRKRNSIKLALSYYEDISDLASLVDLLEEARARGVLKLPEKEAIIREAIVEQYLEHQPEKIEEGLVRVGRQFSTAVGPIDLLARDRKGSYVVVELKRGRTSDRVLGQILRYMAWVAQNLKSRKPVRGIVVAEKVDRGLKYAMKVAKKSGIGLKRYDLRINFWDVE